MNTLLSQDDYLKHILTTSVYDVAIESPLEVAKNLSKRLNNNILLKREELQPVFSFKLRGAYNKMAKLSPEALQKGVIAASAGNHAQGVALGSQKLNCQATIVMPKTTPAIKVKAVQSRGANVVLHGDNYDAAYAHAQELMEQQGLTFIHPYDDPLVIAGQGTIGMEILRQYSKPIDAIFIPIGGGGLIAGIAVYIKALYPNTKIIGVEPQDADAMYQSLNAGERIKLSQVGLFADGVAVRYVGEETFRLCQQYVDEIIRVNTDQICASIKDIFEDTRSILEPSGALALAGLKAYIQEHKLENKTLIAINSGANMNFDRLRHIAERAELGEQREGIIAVTIPEIPGSFKKFCQMLGPRNITEFNYRYADAYSANVFVGISIQDRSECNALVQKLNQEGLVAIDFTDNEIAKIHVRHLVGGHAPQAKNELLYRFEFPERPGALMQFLNQMRSDWNISLFHYRNHGTDYGRVLVGIQVPPEEHQSFSQFLDDLGYLWWDESENPAYRLFLG